ncbi:hypothetical protein AX14_008846 [Amanita brunnescens Koide BX004]|nr:hypothetical protein AX14_008846 [Amanita brunnescens Koide BX004]
MGGHGAVKIDPAIERFNRMREEAYKNFRWTKTTVRTAVLGCVVAPAIIYYFSSAGYRRWDWIARPKGEPLNVSIQKQT